MATPFEVRALYSNQVEQNDDLPFEPGQVITVSSVLDDDWYFGSYETPTGRVEGVFPRNYVEAFKEVAQEAESISAPSTPMTRDLDGNDSPNDEAFRTPEQDHSVEDAMISQNTPIEMAAENGGKVSPKVTKIAESLKEAMPRQSVDAATLGGETNSGSVAAGRAEAVAAPSAKTFEQVLQNQKSTATRTRKSFNFSDDDWGDESESLTNNFKSHMAIFNQQKEEEKAPKPRPGPRKHAFGHDFHITDEAETQIKPHKQTTEGASGENTEEAPARMSLKERIALLQKKHDEEQQHFDVEERRKKSSAHTQSQTNTGITPQSDLAQGNLNADVESSEQPETSLPQPANVFPPQPFDSATANSGTVPTRSGTNPFDNDIPPIPSQLPVTQNPEISPDKNETSAVSKHQIMAPTVPSSRNTASQEKTSSTANAGIPDNPMIVPISTIDQIISTHNENSDIEESEDEEEARRAALRERMARLSGGMGGMNIGMLMGGVSLGHGQTKPRAKRALGPDELAAMTPAERARYEAEQAAEFQVPVSLMGLGNQATSDIMQRLKPSECKDDSYESSSHDALQGSLRLEMENTGVHETRAMDANTLPNSVNTSVVRTKSRETESETTKSSQETPTSLHPTFSNEVEAMNSGRDRHYHEETAAASPFESDETHGSIPIAPPVTKAPIVPVSRDLAQNKHQEFPTPESAPMKSEGAQTFVGPSNSPVPGFPLYGSNVDRGASETVAEVFRASQQGNLLSKKNSHEIGPTSSSAISKSEGVFGPQLPTIHSQAVPNILQPPSPQQARNDGVGAKHSIADAPSPSTSHYMRPAPPPPPPIPHLSNAGHSKFDLCSTSPSPGVPPPVPPGITSGPSVPIPVVPAVSQSSDTSTPLVPPSRPLPSSYSYTDRNVVETRTEHLPNIHRMIPPVLSGADAVHVPQPIVTDPRPLGAVPPPIPPSIPAPPISVAPPLPGLRSVNFDPKPPLPAFQAPAVAAPVPPISQQTPSPLAQIPPSPDDLSISPGTWISAHRGVPPILTQFSCVYYVEEHKSKDAQGKVYRKRKIHVLRSSLTHTIINIKFEESTPLEAQITQEHRRAPSMSVEQLKQFSQQFGEKLINSMTKAKSVAEAMALVPELLTPVGHTYGMVVYKNKANMSIKQMDEIRPGDIAVFRKASLQGTRSLQKYQRDLDNVVALVQSYDNIKRKLKLMDAKKDAVRLNDLKAGEVRVYRPIPRSLVDWNPQTK